MVEIASKCGYVVGRFIRYYYLISEFGRDNALYDYIRYSAWPDCNSDKDSCCTDVDYVLGGHCIATDYI